MHLLNSMHLRYARAGMHLLNRTPTCGTLACDPVHACARCWPLCCGAAHLQRCAVATLLWRCRFVITVRDTRMPVPPASWCPLRDPHFSSIPTDALI
jgi:hypothetical protein